MANFIVLGYPTPIGNKWLIIADHTGPKSYSNIGTSSGTGDLIKASDFAKGGFDFVDPLELGGSGLTYTQSGNYAVKIFTGSSGTTPSVAYPIGNANNGGQPMVQVTLQWFSTGSAFGTIGSEVSNTTDLSAESLRMRYIAV